MNLRILVDQDLTQGNKGRRLANSELRSFMLRDKKGLRDLAFPFLAAWSQGEAIQKG